MAANLGVEVALLLCWHPRCDGPVRAAHLLMALELHRHFENEMRDALHSVGRPQARRLEGMETQVHACGSLDKGIGARRSGRRTRFGPELDKIASSRLPIKVRASLRSSPCGHGTACQAPAWQPRYGRSPSSRWSLHWRLSMVINRCCC